MAFDVLSFLAGIAAGGITGALAMILHGLEKTADLQERLRRVTQEVERIRNASSDSTSSDSNQKAQATELRRELEDIHEEIRRMYKRSTH
jgi:gas vesicle protein